MGFRDSDTIIEPIDDGGAFDSGEGSTSSTSESAANALAAANSAAAALASASLASADKVQTALDRIAVADDLVLTNQDTIDTAADLVLTNADVELTNADVVLAEADKVQTGLDRAATNADVVLTHADVVLTNADVELTNDDVVLTHADVVLTNADVGLTNADVVLTNEDVGLTNADVLLTNADVVLTHADVELTHDDVVLTNADVALAEADKVQTALDRVATNADVVLTHADVVLTNADVGLTNADVLLTNADVELADADKVQTGLDRIAVAADLVLTNQDTIDTAADLGLTNADVVLTHADVVLTNADVVLAEADKVQTGLDRIAVAADLVLTNQDTIDTAADVVLTNADVVLAEADKVQTGLDRVATGNSATSATTSASTATTKASEASTSATNAATSASTATTKASEASASATAAGASETLATAKAALAALSANASANSASTSASSASSASGSATTATNSATASALSATGASNSQIAAASSAAAAAAVFDQFDDTYLGAKSSAPTVDNDGNALVTGALYFDTTLGAMQIWDGSVWIAASAAGTASITNYNFTATAGQVSFSGSDDNSKTLSYTVNSLILTLNGVVLEDGTDYTATNGSVITLSVAAVLNDELNIIAFKTFTTADMVSASNGGTFQGNVDFAAGIDVTGNITVTGTVDGRDVAADGTKLSGIEDNATSDQTGAEIKTAYEAETNAFTDAQFTKLSNIEELADVTDTANVVNSLTAGSNITIAANGTISGSAAYSLPTSSPTVLGGVKVGTNLAISGTGVLSSTNTTYSVGDGGLTQKNFTTTLKTKLDAIAEGATNVTNNNQLTNGAGYTTSVGDITGVTAGSGITGGGTSGTVTVTHGATSSQASLTALTGAAVVSDIDLDGFGHVTNLTTRNMTLANLGYTGATNANNSVSNATHTGEVTGSGALTVADNVIDAGNLKVTGNGTTSQWLRSDGDGTMSWVTPPNTVYTLPLATTTVRGGIELYSNTDQTVAPNTVTATASRTYGLQLNSANQAMVNVPWVNTTYSVGAGGLTQQNFTTTLKNKLDAIAASANNYSLPAIPSVTSLNVADKIIHTGDTDSYFQFQGANLARLVLAGAEVQKWGDSYTLFNDNDTVRLGNSSDFRMYFDGADTIFRNYAHANGDVYFQGEGSDGVNETALGLDFSGTASYVRLFQNSAEKLRTTSGGAAAMGLFIGNLTTNPHNAGALEVGGANGEKIVLSGAAQPYIRFQEGTTDKAYIQWNNDGYVQFRNQETGNFRFRSSGTEYSVKLQFEASDADLYGSVYATHSNEIGFLDNGNDWAYRIQDGSIHEWRINNGVEMSLTTATLDMKGNTITEVEDIGLRDRLYHDGDSDTYLDFDTNQVSIAAGGYTPLYVNTTGVRLGDSGNGYFQPVSGNYGSIQIDGGNHGGYEGYSIGARAVFMHNNSSNTGIFNDVENEWLFLAQHNGYARMYYNGTHKIETTNTGVTVTGDLNSTSDIRYKKNIEAIDGALDKVKSLKGVTFEWDNDAFRADENTKKPNFTRRATGVIAQDVEKVLPEAVCENEDGMKNVAYGNMVGLLIEAIKEQQVQIDELKAQLNS